MKLTPLDIKKQEFKKTLRGFDCVEVETFLEMVADEYEQLIAERNQLSDELNKLRTQLLDYQQVEKTLRETLMTAQEAVNRSRRNSEKEAALIIREAEIKAEKLLEKTKTELAEMKNELMLVKAEKESFTKRLKHLLQSQLELIDVLEIEDLDFEKREKTAVAKTPLKQAAVDYDGESSNGTLPDERPEKQITTDQEESRSSKSSSKGKDEDSDQVIV